MLQAVSSIRFGDQMSILELRLFGALQLTEYGNEVQVRSAKSRALLAYLALDGKSSRAELAGLLWQREQQQARASLRNALLALRTDLGLHAALVQSDRAQIWLHPHQVTLDVDEISNSTGSQLLTLWRGSFLKDLLLQDSPPWHEWIQRQSDHFSTLYLERALTLAHQALRSGNAQQAERLAERMLEIDPLSEAAAGLLVQSYRQSNRGETARQFAARFERQFQAETGHIVDLSDPLPRESNASPALNVNNLPRPLTSFIGRQYERRLLLEALSSDQSRLITLHGSGGIGKTHLAIEVAWAQTRVPGIKGVVYISLEHRRRPELLGQHLLDGLGLPLGPDPWVDLQRHVGDQHYVFVLDNFDDLLITTPQLLILLSACPQLRLLITSREALGVHAETLLSLTGMDVPSPGDPLARAREADAMRLFEHRARQADLSFELGPVNLSVVVDLCRLLGGSPLGIELAAAWLRYMSPEELLQTLSRDVLSLSAPYRDTPERHQTIQSVFEHSWHRLSDTERTGLQQLGVFPVSFTAKAAQAITDLQVPALRQLVDKSLIRLEGDRFSFHPLVRQFIQEKFELNADVRRQILARHGAHYLGILTRLNQETSGGVSSDLLDFTRLEERHVLQALKWLIGEGKYNDLPLVVEPLQWHFAVQGRIAEGKALFGRLLLAVPTGLPNWGAARAALLTSLGWYEHFFGDLKQAETLCRAALQEATDVQNDLEHSRAANGLGEVCYRSGRSYLAVPYLQQAILLTPNDEVRRYRTRINLGVAQALSHQLDEALKTFDDLQHFLEPGQAPQAMDAVTHHTCLGVTRFLGRQFRSSIAAYEDGLALAQRIGSEGQSWGLRAFVALARLEDALLENTPNTTTRTRQICSDALAREEECADPFARVLLHAVQGRLMLLDGMARGAARSCRTSLQLALDVRNVLGMLWSLPYFLQVLGSAELNAKVRTELQTTRMVDPWVQWQLERLPVGQVTASRMIAKEEMDDHTRLERTVQELLLTSKA